LRSLRATTKSVDFMRAAPALDAPPSLRRAMNVLQQQHSLKRCSHLAAPMKRVSA
jgi:hypothetical protein